MKKLLLLLISILLVAGACLASSSTTGISSANYLKLHSGVRAAGMGNAFIALADDPSAIYWNPAGLSQIERLEMTSAYTSWFQDMNYTNISVVAPMLRNTLGVAVNYFNYGAMAETNAAHPYGTGITYNPTDIDITASFARKMHPDISLGANLRLISRNLPGKVSSGYGIDIGALSRFRENIFIGLNVRNLISSIGPSSGPSNYGIGLSYRDEPLILALDVNFPTDNNVLVCLGAEYNLKDVFFCRIGYNSRSETDAGGNLGAGLGLRLKNMDFDYAYVPYGELGPTHRVSVTLRPFGPAEEKAAKVVIAPEDVTMIVSREVQFKVAGFTGRGERIKMDPKWSVRGDTGRITAECRDISVETSATVLKETE